MALKMAMEMLQFKFIDHFDSTARFEFLLGIDLNSFVFCYLNKFKVLYLNEWTSNTVNIKYEACW